MEGLLVFNISVAERLSFSAPGSTVQGHIWVFQVSNIISWAKKHSRNLLTFWLMFEKLLFQQRAIIEEKFHLTLVY